MLESIRSRAKSFGVMVIFGVIIVVFIFWGVGNFGGMSIRNLAVVNGEGISVEDFRKAFVPTARAREKAEPDIFDNPGKTRQLKREVLAELIKQRLCLQEAERLGLVITPQELRRALESFTVFHDESGKFNKDMYLQLLAARGLAPGDFEEEYSRELLERKLFRYIGMSAGVNEGEARNLYEFSLEKRKVEYVLFNPEDYLAEASVTEEEALQDYEASKETFRAPETASVDFVRLTPETLANGYAVSDAEAQAYYTENSESLRKPDRFLSRHIFISFPMQRENGEALSDEEKTLAAQELMDKALAELAQGRDFADVAREYSHDQMTAQNGGLLDWAERGQIPLKAFEDAAFALNPGEVSKPVRSEFGLHLIKLEEKQEASLPAFAQAREEILRTLALQRAEADFANVQRLASDGLTLNTPLEELAAKLSAKLENTGMVTKEEVEKRLSLLSDSRQLLEDAIAEVAASSPQDVASGGADDTASGAAFFASGMTMPVPVNIDNGIALVRVRDARPSRIPAFEEVRAAITARLKAEQSRALARADAEKALPSFTGTAVPEAYKDKALMSREAARAFPVVEPLGNAEALLQGVFTSAGEWLPSVYDTPKGPVIARCASVEQVSEEDWQKWKGVFLPQMLEARRNEMIGAFLLGLDEKAKVESHLDLLDGLSVNRRGQ